MKELTIDDVSSVIKLFIDNDEEIIYERLKSEYSFKEIQIIISSMKVGYKLFKLLDGDLTDNFTDSEIENTAMISYITTRINLLFRKHNITE